MHIDLAKLPDNIDSFKAIITSFAKKNQDYQLENELLREKIRSLQAQLYGRKTEKLFHVTEVDQPTLFDEAEQNVSAPEEEATQETEVSGYTRKIRGRKPLPADLP